MTFLTRWEEVLVRATFTNSSKAASGSVGDERVLSTTGIGVRCGAAGASADDEEGREAAECDASVAEAAVENEAEDRRGRPVSLGAPARPRPFASTAT